ncbi:osmotically inducible protein OsmC [Kribbella steppae]|uniref:Osmotically inducible protein OsmC n=1 Tax=Kribbella steppae TaxID=2512223 RepID=A0A4V2S1B4_9ACTN|nr:OsmC family peroxiredoxin [Kribbella steppae]TCO35980.1 osmotically inducible protein OsmC [Kribbella steppae]
MAATRSAKAHWEGSLLEGAGQVSLESSGLGTFDVTWAARTNDKAEGKTSPEELIAAAHSSCFNMALSNILAKAGHAPESLDTTADVTFQPGEGITGSKISVNGKVPSLTADEFAQYAEDAKKNCPVSQALTGTTITLDVSFTA